MATRIIFNGQEYASPEAMPEDVRRMYQQALAQFADADYNGIPDVLEGRGDAAKPVIGIQNSSITVNGKTYGSVEEMPGFARFLYEAAMRHLDQGRLTATDRQEGYAGQRNIEPNQRNTEPEPGPDDRLMRALDQSENVLSTVLVLVLAAAAGAVIVLGSWMIAHMDAGSRSQGGVIYVALGMVVVLGAIAGQFVNLWWRRQK
ncbi:MAG TPA: hypothetical protein VH763_11615 [Gemmatimonadales bacterium]|jgi:hypothetical protein